MRLTKGCPAPNRNGNDFIICVFVTAGGSCKVCTVPIARRDDDTMKRDASFFLTICPQSARAAPPQAWDCDRRSLSARPNKRSRGAGRHTAAHTSHHHRAAKIDLGRLGHGGRAAGAHALGHEAVSRQKQTRLGARAVHHLAAGLAYALAQQRDLLVAHVAHAGLVEKLLRPVSLRAARAISEGRCCAQAGGRARACWKKVRLRPCPTAESTRCACCVARHWRMAAIHSSCSFSSAAANTSVTRSFVAEFSLPVRTWNWNGVSAAAL